MIINYIPSTGSGKASHPCRMPQKLSFCSTLGSLHKANKQSILNENEKVLLQKYINQYDLKKIKPLSTFIKNISDKLLASIGIIILTPVMLLSALAIKCEQKDASPLFKQERYGKNCEPFTIYKLRTMWANSTPLDNNPKFIKTKDDPRITKVGRFLRKYSLDELPQLFNILRGDMSFVGPRPLSINAHIKRNIGSDFLKRYAVKPGANLQYHSNDLHDAIKVENDYVNNWSLGKDIKTIFLIIYDILKGNNC